MTPIPCTWDGEAMRPLARFAKRCDQEFVVGECYAVSVEHERSQASHRQYFAALNDAWLNLPETDERFPTSEHLRKWALIQCGFCDERSAVFQSAEDARKAAALIAPADDYAVVVHSGPVVKVYTAKSQSVRAMGKDDFQKSKQAVLELVSNLSGTGAADLVANAESIA